MGTEFLFNNLNYEAYLHENSSNVFASNVAFMGYRLYAEGKYRT